MTRDCSNCGSSNTEHVEESHSVHLYRHRDDFQQCLDCGRMEAYRGAALEDVELGLAFYDVEARTRAERPRCEDHRVNMVPTKIWPTEGRVQFKCDAPTETGPCQAVEYVELEDVNDE